MSVSCPARPVAFGDRSRGGGCSRPRHRRRQEHSGFRAVPRTVTLEACFLFTSCSRYTYKQGSPQFTAEKASQLSIAVSPCCLCPVT